jgi:hypothetical protein
LTWADIGRSWPASLASTVLITVYAVLGAIAALVGAALIDAGRNR